MLTYEALSKMVGSETQIKAINDRKKLNSPRVFQAVGHKLLVGLRPSFVG
jgi:hypothetical protein